MSLRFPNAGVHAALEIMRAFKQPPPRTIPILQSVDGDCFFFFFFAQVSSHREELEFPRNSQTNAFIVFGKH